MKALIVLAALVAKAAALHVDPNPTTSQIHLAYQGDDGMVVSWNTLDKVSKPTVKYGLSKDKLVYTATSDESVIYKTSESWNNHVALSGLKPDTEYWYMPEGVLAHEATPGPYTFKTARPAGSSKPHTAAFVCDLGTMGRLGLGTTADDSVDPNAVLKPGEKNTIDSLTSTIDSYDFVLHPGDLAYADYWLKEDLKGYLPNQTLDDGVKLYNSILNEFYDEMESVTASRPYMVGPGNHEANCDNGGSGNYTSSICMPGQTNFTGYINHFRMPASTSNGVGNMWYSFDYGQTHYVFFTTETDLGNGLQGPDEDPSGIYAGPFGSYPNEQIDWLKNDLSNVDRCKTPWVVALGHRPWFVSSSPCIPCQKAFASIFEEHKVDAVMQGHVHVYRRNYPTYANGSLDPAGYDNPSTPMYIINGIAGHYDGMDAFDDVKKPYQAAGLDVDDGVYGWSRMHFYNSTHMKHEFVASNNDTVLDSVILRRDHVCKSTGPSTATVTGSVSTTEAAATTAPATHLTTSTVRTTTLITITSCAPTVTNCPADSTTVITSTKDLYTTVCPVTEAFPTATAETTAVGSSVSVSGSMSTGNTDIGLPVVPSASMSWGNSASSLSAGADTSVTTVPVGTVSPVAPGSPSSTASVPAAGGARSVVISWSAMSILLGTVAMLF